MTTLVTTVHHEGHKTIIKTHTDTRAGIPGQPPIAVRKVFDGKYYTLAVAGTTALLTHVEMYLSQVSETFLSFSQPTNTMKELTTMMDELRTIGFLDDNRHGGILLVGCPTGVYTLYNGTVARNESMGGAGSGLANFNVILSAYRRLEHLLTDTDIVKEAFLQSVEIDQHSSGYGYCEIIINGEDSTAY